MAGNDNLIARLHNAERVQFRACDWTWMPIHNADARKLFIEAATALTDRDAQIERLTKEREDLTSAIIRVMQDNFGFAARDYWKDGVSCADFPNMLGQTFKGLLSSYTEAEARAETAERERDEARAEVERLKEQRKDLVIHITCALAHYKALGWIEDDVPSNIEQAYVETFHPSRAAITAKGGENADS